MNEAGQRAAPQPPLIAAHRGTVAIEIGASRIELHLSGRIGDAYSGLRAERPAFRLTAVKRSLRLAQSGPPHLRRRAL